MHEEERNWEGVWIPFSSYTTPDAPLHHLTHGEQVLYCLIYGLAKTKGYCRSTNAWMAKALNCSPTSIGDMVAELKSKGVLSCRVVRNKRRLSPLVVLEERDSEEE